MLVHMMYISVLNAVCTCFVIKEREREIERSCYRPPGDGQFLPDVTTLGYVKFTIVLSPKVCEQLRIGYTVQCGTKINMADHC